MRLVNHVALLVEVITTKKTVSRVKMGLWMLKNKKWEQVEFGLDSVRKQSLINKMET